MNLYKKIISCALLLLVAAPLFIYAIFCIKQKIIQVQMQEALEQSSLQTIVINKVEVNWEEEGKEIIINGELFDVKSYNTTTTDSVILTGIYDKEETALIKKVEQLQNQKNKSKTPLDNLVLKFMFTVALLPDKPMQKVYYLIALNKFYNYTDALHLQNTDVESPPPIV
jgi:hypothetical protein